MSAHALAGLAVLNILFLLCGVAAMWVLHGLETWGQVVRLAGLAYLVGVVTVGSVWTLLLVAGGPFGAWLVLAIPFLVVAIAAFVGRRRGRGRPGRGAVPTGNGILIAAIGIATAGVLIEALLRRSRLAGLYEWDAWAFWVPKAKAIYYFGRLDENVFTTLPGPSYPPLVPVLDAAAFHLMGSPDVVTLHVQYALLGIGFVWALAGVLAERVPAWILWPFVLLVLVAPRIGPRFQITEADLLLDFLFVLAALLVVLWILDRESWRLVTAILMMCGMVLTKREGLLLAALLLAAAALASVRDWRFVWPRLALSGVVVLAVAAPWRIWYLVHGVSSEGPSEGLDPTQNTERLWPSLKLAFDVLFSSDYWSVIVPVAIGAAALAVFARAFVLAGFVVTLVTLVTLGGGWITWSIPELPITQDLGGNPIVRYIGAAALLCVAASPLLLASAWSAVTSREQDATP